MTLSLVIFDVDGTLVDSQGHIMAAMRHAFDACGLALPERHQIMTRIGMSLPLLMGELAGPEHAPALTDAYRGSFAALRDSMTTSPLYPGTQEMLRALNARPDMLLAVATGKSKRGLDLLVEAYGWDDLFVSRQTADFHPSKPHPSMIETVLDDSGVSPARTVMVGDTRFDIDMARNAGVASIAVPWGYNDPADLGADATIDSWDDLDAALQRLWKD